MDNTTWYESRSLDSFTVKRLSFSYEQEVRTIIGAIPVEGISYNSEPVVDLDKEIFGYGEEVNVDIGVLIHKVYLSPYAPSWHLPLLKSLLDVYGLKVDIIRSQLYTNDLR